jgi:hypothetical protein
MAAAAAWYFSKAPLLGTSKAGDCTRLCAADSAALEAAHAALGSPPRHILPAAVPAAAAASAATSAPAPAGLVVRSGLWEGDAASLRWLTPCYPSDAAGSLGSDAPPLCLVRATWFLEAKADLYPIGEPLSAQLESAYTLAGAGAASVAAAAAAAAAAGAALTPPIAHRAQLGGPGLPAGLLAVFTPDGEAWLVPDGYAAKLSAAVGASFDRGATAAAASAALAASAGAAGLALPPAPGAVRLRRGFSEAAAAPLAEDEAADARAAGAGDVTHLVLTTHGVGHSLEFVDAASNAASLRAAMRKLPAALGGGGATGSGSNTPGGLASPAAPPSPFSSASASANVSAAPPGRMLLLPVQWRKGLALAGDEGALDALLPDTAALRPLRSVLNALVSDVLRYMTADGQKMADALTAALNDTFGRFMARNPNFKGPVSVVAHSLGSVLMYDLLSGSGAGSVAGIISGSGGGSGGGGGDAAAVAVAAAAAASAAASAAAAAAAAGGDAAAALAAENAALRAALSAASAALSSLASSSSSASASAAMEPPPSTHVPIARAPLAFSVDALLLLGSPLGLFLALRGGGSLGGTSATSASQSASQKSASQNASSLKCRRLYNVMHPYDPIAYRIEPLAWPPGAPGAAAAPPHHRPAEVPYCRGGRRIQAEVSDKVEAISSSLRGSMSFAGGLSLGGALKSKLASAMATAAGALPAGAMSASASAAVNPAGGAAADAAGGGMSAAEGDAAAAAVLRRLAGGEEPSRLDFQLQTGDLNPFLSALMAHTAYWACPDTALFILRACGPPTGTPPGAALAG